MDTKYALRMGLKGRIMAIVVMLFSLLNVSAQTVAGLPREVKAGDARITKMGHATLTVGKEQAADSEMRVEKVEWNTSTGTAKARIANRRKVDSGGLYNKGTHWWWDLWWFTYDYPSINAQGEPIMLSSMVCMPDEDCEHVNNVVIACHITLTANRECPSQHTLSSISNMGDVYAYMLHASSGLLGNAKQDDMPYYNLVIIPDYEGYGITKERAHPYLSSELTARQVVDAARYGLELYRNASEIDAVRHPFRDGWRTFSVGYSQGGATSMAVHRFIEQNHLTDELQFSGSVCGDGPYNPMTTLMYYTHQALNEKPMAMAVVLPLILKGMCDSNPYMRNHQVSDYMKDRFLETGILDWLDSKEKSTGEIASGWKNLWKSGKNGDANYYKDVLTESGGEAYLKNIMKGEACEYFQHLLEPYLDQKNLFALDASTELADGAFADDYIHIADPEKPALRGLMEDLHYALSYNDITKGWNPQHPIYLFHSYNDEVVPLCNRISAYQLLGDVVQRVKSSSNRDHTNAGVEFFTGTEEQACVRALADSEVHPLVAKSGEGEVIYNGTVALNGEDIPAQYVLRTDEETGSTYALLGSGYNACISQYLSGEIVVPGQVSLDGETYDVGGINDLAFLMCTEITRVVIPKGVERIGNFAFYASTGLKEVDLPSSLATIGTGAFIDLPNLESVICRAQTPPTWEYNDVFRLHKDGISDTETYSTDDVKLWVPEGSQQAYQDANFTNPDLGWTTADGWGYFGQNIQTLESTGLPFIGILPSTSSHIDSGWFSVDGRYLQRQPLRPGLYIHNGRKVVK